MLELLKEHLAQFAAGDWDNYKAALAPNAVYEETATMQKANGPEAIVEHMKRWKRAFPDSEAKFINGFESGDQLIAEIEWNGTHSGPLEGPFGTIQATNKRGTLRAVIVAEVKDKKVASVRHYFDLLTLLTQMGVTPFAGAPQPSAKPAQVPPTRH